MKPRPSWSQFYKLPLPTLHSHSCADRTSTAAGRGRHSGLANMVNRKGHGSMPLVLRNFSESDSIQQCNTTGFPGALSL